MLTDTRVCTRPGCTRPWLSRRMCASHYEQWRTRNRAYGRPTSQFVDAQPARDHINQLSAAGISWKQLHELSGVPLSSIGRIIRGRTERGEPPTRQIMPHVEAKILAVPIPGVWWTHSANHRVGDPTGTTRRLQALVAAGWTQTDIATRIGVTTGNATPLFFGRRDVTAATARAVAALFDELALTPGPSPRARQRARRLGWLLPLDWDEDTIYSNSIYLYSDKIIIRTYNHTKGIWLPVFDRVVTLPEWCRAVA